MTIDEKIKQAADGQSMRLTSSLIDADTRARIFTNGANYAKSEMLADMQKLVEALEFYADMAKDDNKNLDGCLERACIDRAESQEYNLSGKYVAEKSLQALSEFNAKYKEQK